jgi:hypothetical protein
VAADTADADGRVLFCLPRDADDREAMRGLEGDSRCRRFCSFVD